MHACALPCTYFIGYHSCLNVGSCKKSLKYALPDLLLFIEEEKIINPCLFYVIYSPTRLHTHKPPRYFRGQKSRIRNSSTILVSLSYQEHVWISFCLPSEEAAILRNSLGRAERNRKEHNSTYSFYFCILVTIYFYYYVYFCECVGCLFFAIKLITF